MTTKDVQKTKANYSVAQHLITDHVMQIEHYGNCALITISTGYLSNIPKGKLLLEMATSNFINLLRSCNREPIMTQLISDTQLEAMLDTKWDLVFHEGDTL